MREMLVWVQMHRSIYEHEGDKRKKKKPHLGSERVDGLRFDADLDLVFFFFTERSRFNLRRCCSRASLHDRRRDVGNGL